MMSDAAVISGDFCTFRHVQGRKVLQIVIEVPAEAAGSVFAKLGMPGSGEGIPVAVARLHSPAEPIAKPEAPKERRGFTTMALATQAGIRCNEPEFETFLRSKVPMNAVVPFDPNKDEPFTALLLRWLLSIESRRELDLDAAKGAEWQALEAEYWAWQRGAR